MIKRQCISLIAAFICIISVFSVNLVPAFEYSASPCAESGGISVQAEQTEWYYRVVDGRLEKRLWSRTYGRWLTDWIRVGSN